MPNDDFEQLGTTEKFAAEQLKSAISDSLKNARVLVEELEKIDLDDIEGALLNAKLKEGIVKIIPTMQGLNANLATACMVPIVLGIMCKREGSSNA